MNQNIILTIVEFIASLILEGVILGFIFQLISNRSQDKQEKNLQAEMTKIEQQNKFNTTQIITGIKDARDDVLAEIKESAEYIRTK